MKKIQLIVILLFATHFLLAQKSGTFIDARDGHKYKWVQIGEQVWMAENLAYLPSVDSPYNENIYLFKNGQMDIEGLDSVYQYVFNYFGENLEEAKATDSYKKFGVLYNYASATQSCPDGWHLPSDAEWKELEAYIGMEKTEIKLMTYVRGDKGAKLRDIFSWPDVAKGSDDYGFAAIPSGILLVGASKDKEGTRFAWQGEATYFWSIDESEIMGQKLDAISRVLMNSTMGSDISRCIGRYPRSKELGLSVRCIKNK